MHQMVSGIITIAALAGGRGMFYLKFVINLRIPIREMTNTQLDNAKDIVVVMPMYDLIEYSNNCSKTSGSLQQYYRDELALGDADALANFPGNSALFKYKQTITG